MGERAKGVVETRLQRPNTSCDFAKLGGSWSREWRQAAAQTDTPRNFELGYHPHRGRRIARLPLRWPFLRTKAVLALGELARLLDRVSRQWLAEDPRCERL